MERGGEKKTSNLRVLFYSVVNASPKHSSSLVCVHSRYHLMFSCSHNLILIDIKRNPHKYTVPLTRPGSNSLENSTGAVTQRCPRYFKPQAQMVSVAGSVTWVSEPRSSLQMPYRRLARLKRLVPAGGGAKLCRWMNWFGGVLYLQARFPEQ